MSYGKISPIETQKVPYVSGFFLHVREYLSKNRTMRQHMTLWFNGSVFGQRIFESDNCESYSVGGKIYTVTPAHPWVENTCMGKIETFIDAPCASKALAQRIFEDAVDACLEGNRVEMHFSNARRTF